MQFNLATNFANQQGKRTKTLQILNWTGFPLSPFRGQARNDMICFRYSGRRPGIYEFNAFALRQSAGGSGKPVQFI
jgi:hypothetical protein